MIDAVQIFWSPAGVNMPSLGAKALVDVTDGDTPNIRMPVRMLSIDTPEITARSDKRAQAIDEEFAELADWIRQRRAPISPEYGDDVLPRLAGGGTRQFAQGQEASAFAKANMAARLTRPNGEKRNLFIRMADAPFDGNGRLLAYVAPNYSAAERRTMGRKERATFNLDLVESGWAASFVLYPAIPGALDLPLLIEAAHAARVEKRGIWADEAVLPAYEYRAMEKLYAVTKKIIERRELRAGEPFSWRERYCVDMRSRRLHGPEDYFGIEPEYRLWLWPKDVAEAVSRLNLVPAPKLVGAA